MIEPLTLGAIAAFLAAKAMERAGDEVVDAGAKAMHRVLKSLRRYFQSEDPEGAKSLERLSEAPDSPSRIGELAKAIDAAADRSPELRGELETLIRETQQAGIAIDSINQSAEGQGNIQIAGIANSEIAIGERPAPPSEK